MRAPPLALWGGLCVAVVVFAATLLTASPRLWYLPEARSWTWGLAPQQVGIDFYGRLIWALGAGGMAMGILTTLARSTSPRLRRTFQGLHRTLAGWALIAIWVAAWLITLALAARALGGGP